MFAVILVDIQKIAYRKLRMLNNAASRNELRIPLIRSTGLAV
jgi:hypothetical protein